MLQISCTYETITIGMLSVYSYNISICEVLAQIFAVSTFLEYMRIWWFYYELNKTEFW